MFININISFTSCVYCIISANCIITLNKKLNKNSFGLVIAVFLYTIIYYTHCSSAHLLSKCILLAYIIYFGS